MKKHKATKQAQEAITIPSWKPQWEIMASLCSKQSDAEEKENPKQTCTLPAGIWMFSCFPGVGNRAHDGFS